MQGEKKTFFFVLSGGRGHERRDEGESCTY